MRLTQWAAQANSYHARTWAPREYHRSSHAKGAMMPLSSDFLWGASTAAHQIEGDNYNSDFWAAEQAGLPHIPDKSGSACDSFHRYREDIRLLAESGLNTYRFSIEWARIEPADGQFSRAALLHYRDMIDACHEYGVTPVITLHHFTCPLWFSAGGGVNRADASQRFADYVRFVAPILHDVKWIVTINEPNILALFSLFTQVNQGEKDRAKSQDASEKDAPTEAMAQLPAPPYDIAERLIAMHKAAVAVLRELTPQAKVGWAIACQAFTPTEGNEQVWEKVVHQWEDVYFKACDGDDFVGIQAYTSQPVDANGPVPHPESEDNTLTGWAYRPDALGYNLRRVWQTFGIPMMVTENGIATGDDQRRIAYTTEALRGMAEAIRDGADVRGYCHWSLLDNYEWGRWAPTFGLIAVDRECSFERHPKPSLAWLGEVARTSGASIGL